MAAYSYKTKELLDSKVNFAAIYFDKQERIKEMTGFDFNLADIVRFVKSETDNFQNQIELAMEIDKAIYGIYNNWIRETGEKQPAPAPAPAPTEEQPSETENETVKRFRREMEEIEFLLSIETDKKQINRFNKELDELQTLIDIELES